MNINRNPYAARVDAMPDGDFALLEQAVAARSCREKIGYGTFDEVYVNDTDLSKGYGQARKRGLSGQKLCIAIAIDASKDPVAVVCGRGKPSARRIKAALDPHLAEGSTVVHDKERAHNGLIAERRCGSEAYKADATYRT